MAGSQLKRLKASLKEQGIIKPQQSKKQKRRAAQDDKARNDKRLARGAVLEGIREQFNPFDLKHAKAPKFEVATSQPTKGAIRGRPGEAKAAAEQRRRETLLVDMQHRHKVGGILDQRFGENDPTMTPEEKMLERFAREKLKSHKKNSMFDLEDDDDDMAGGLTHGGKALTFNDEQPVDDFDEDDLSGNESDVSIREQQRRKRMRAMDGFGPAPGEEEDEPERKKTKKEVMEEVIAKSKLHKFERQQAKEEDEDLRAELDQELPDLRSLLYSTQSKAKANGDSQAAAIGGVNRDEFDRNFDLQVRKLAQDKRAQPADRTKTEEEKAEDESKRLKELEEKRQKRMRGEPVSDSDEDEDDKQSANGAEGPDFMDEDEDEDFGLGTGIKTRPTATELGFDDEDDFVIDDNLVASGSDLDLDSDVDLSQEEDDSEGSEGGEEEEEDDDFTKGLLNEEEARNPVFEADSSAKTSALKKGDEHGLPFTFSCPQSKEEFETTIKSYPFERIPTIVQRIRALYHPKLDSKNKERLANFSLALVDFITSPYDTPFDAKTWPPFSVLESLIRHIHSLSKMFPIEIAVHCRELIEEMGSDRPLALEVGDLILLTAIGTIFPTSDHFHQVATPAMLTITRYLGQKIPKALSDHAFGLYLSILSLQYQQFSKRYVPEFMNFTLNTICALSPAAPSSDLGRFPLHDSEASLRAKGAKDATPRRLNFADCVEDSSTADVKVAILDTALQVCDAAADIWSGKEAFTETFDQVLAVVKHLSSQKSRGHVPAQLVDRADKLQKKLERMIKLANVARRPLELHHHRPLAIKTFVPKFEDTYDPNKHYDPDKDRAELAKLKKEHKRERKGAMRELRKDANFMAREKLKIKKAKDEAYEKKYKRLVAEIQSEEGREANEYEREKKARKRAKNR